MLWRSEEDDIPSCRNQEGPWGKAQFKTNLKEELVFYQTKMQAAYFSPSPEC